MKRWLYSASWLYPVLPCWAEPTTSLIPSAVVLRWGLSSMFELSPEYPRGHTPLQGQTQCGSHTITHKLAQANIPARAAFFWERQQGLKQQRPPPPPPASTSGGLGDSGGSDRLVNTSAGLVASVAGVAISHTEIAASVGRFDLTGRAEAHRAASSLGGGSSSRAHACTCSHAYKSVRSLAPSQRRNALGDRIRCCCQVRSSTLF